ncbi:MAG: hypothetical protein V2A67_11545 [Bacteroidota bacterium]
MNKISKWISYLIVILLLTFNYSIASAQTQNHLILKKNGYHNRLQYFTGDDISFIRKGNSYIESGVLQGIGTDRIIIAGEEIPINNIGRLVFHRTSFNFKTGGSIIMLASPLYLILGAVNAFIEDSRPVWTTGSFMVAGSIAATGLLFDSLQVRRFPLGKKFQLRIVQSDPTLNH